jgi:hypothetical protein
MRLLPLAAAALALPLPAQDSPFESSDFGVRLKIPAGWTIDATRQARVILKLTLSGDGPVKPELLVYEAALAEPVTPAQYKEQLRHFLQRAYKEPRMVEDRAVTAGGRSGFVLGVASKGAGDVDVVSLKGLIEISPKRMLGVDGVFPRGREEALGKVYDALLASVEFIPRKSPIGTEDGLRQLAQAVEKIFKTPAPPEGPTELGVFAGDKRIGTYTITLKPGTRGAAAGWELESAFRVDLGEEGRSESHVTGFLSHDLATQAAEVAESKVGKDKRAQNFSASVNLAGGEVRSVRRINGERVETRFKVPERAILGELEEALKVRLLELGKGLVSVPVVSAFENEPGYLRIELAGPQKKPVGGAEAEVHVLLVQREDGSVVTDWHDKDRRPAQISYSNTSLLLRRAK